MIRSLLVAVLLLSATASNAQERVGLGLARVFNNDYLGDGKDRWRTGSYQLSYFRGPVWDGTRPGVLGELLEFRLRGETIAPDNLQNPAPGDRRHVGVLSLGLHSYATRGGMDYEGGIDLVAVGPQTGVLSMQKRLHKLLGATAPRVDNFQIGNAIRPTARFEVAREMQIGRARLRPFAEVQAGAETLVRVGSDLTVGSFGIGALRMRDVVTGQRMPGIQSDEAGEGTSFLLGGDVAHVTDSVYLPRDLGYRLEEGRARLRAGVHHSWGSGAIFYGATYLSPEFEAQAEGQTVGSVTLKFNF